MLGLRIITLVACWFVLVGVTIPVRSFISLEELESVKLILGKPGLSIKPQSTASLVDECGYYSQNYNVPSRQDGYVINVVRITNPLIDSDKIKKKLPVLFVHGLVENANSWLIMGYGGLAQDWSELDEASLSKEELEVILGKDRTARSLPLLMSNFGYDVWLMNMRGARDSRLASPNWHHPVQKDPEEANQRFLGQGGSVEATDLAKQNRVSRKRRAVEASKMNPIHLLHDMGGKTPGELVSIIKKTIKIDRTDRSFFNYAYDEQAKNDLPAVINFILEQTGKAKLNVVGYSAGGLINIMLLSTQPEYNDKINHAALLAPAINLHYDNLRSLFFQVFSALELVFSTTIGSLNGILFVLAGAIISLPTCAKDKFMGYPCSLSIDGTFGLGSDQFDVPAFFGTLPTWTDDSSLHEMAQLIQSGQRNQIQFFDYRDPVRNAQSYGGFDVPKYNLTNVSLKSMSIWQGNTDRLVNQFNTHTLLQALKNPWDFHFIGNSTEHILFNHLGFQFHENIVKLLNIPVLKRIAAAGHTGT